MVDNGYGCLVVINLGLVGWYWIKDVGFCSYIIVFIYLI